VRCELVGHTRLADPHAAAAAFQQRWGGAELRLARSDCRTHAAALVRLLLEQQ
jgi:hypothetical protein